MLAVDRRSGWEGVWSLQKITFKVSAKWHFPLDGRLPPKALFPQRRTGHREPLFRPCPARASYFSPEVLLLTNLPPKALVSYSPLKIKGPLKNQAVWGTAATTICVKILLKKNSTYLCQSHRRIIIIILLELNFGKPSLIPSPWGSGSCFNENNYFSCSKFSLIHASDSSSYFPRS